MRPSFPTLTFPNHTTLVTGLRPDRSGIVANMILRSRARRRQSSTARRWQPAIPFWWSQHEPLWITAERAGIRSGTMFWPGSEAPHNGARQSDWVRFDPNITTQMRVAERDRLASPARVDPAAVRRDSTSMTSIGSATSMGPRAPETMAAVRGVDAAVGQLRRA